METNPYQAPRETHVEKHVKKRFNWWILFAVIFVAWVVLLGILPAINALMSG